MLNKETAIGDVVGTMHQKIDDADNAKLAKKALAVKAAREQALIGLAKQPVNRSTIVRAWSLFSEMKAAEGYTR